MGFYEFKNKKFLFFIKFWMGDASMDSNGNVAETFQETSRFLSSLPKKSFQANVWIKHEFMNRMIQNNRTWVHFKKKIKKETTFPGYSSDSGWSKNCLAFTFARPGTNLAMSIEKRCLSYPNVEFFK